MSIVPRQIYRVISNGIEWGIRHPGDPRRTSGDLKAYFAMRNSMRRGERPKPRKIYKAHA